MWWYVVIAVVAFAVGLALAPKPSNFTQQPGNVQAPTADEGRDIAVLFGSRDIDGPNVVWFGDIKTSAVKK